MTEIRIGNVLKRSLKAQQKNLKVVSKETGIPYSTLHTWQENRQPKDILKAQKLANYFGITLHELLFDRAEAVTPEKIKDIFTTPKDLFQGRFEVLIKKID